MFDKEEIDGVIIASPVGLHVENALECVKRDIPFLMEKPLSLSAIQAQPLLTELEKSNMPNMIGYMARNIDSFKKGKEIIDSGCLGNIQYVKGTVYVSQLFKKGKGWRYDPKISGGGVLLSQGSHLIDLLTWYFGYIKRVNCDILSVYSPGIEDFAHVMMNFESGLKGWIDASWSVRFKRKMELKIDILGDNGSLVITDDTLQLFLDKEAGDWPKGKTYLSANDLFSGVYIDIGGAKFTYQAKKFLDSIEKRESVQPDIKHGYHVQQIVDASYESAQKNGMPIEISVLNN
jgi:predicted dehydrogenase